MHSRLKSGAACSANMPVPSTRGADDVVVGERRAVVAIGIGECVADRGATGPRAERSGRSRGHAARARAPGAIRAARRSTKRPDVRRDRQAPEDLLVLDQLGAGGAHALHHQIEAIRARSRPMPS